MRGRDDKPSTEVIDDAVVAVESELKSQLEVHPSPEFLARVRMTLAQERQPARWSFGWPAAAVAVAVIIALMSVTFVRRAGVWPASPTPLELVRSIEGSPLAPTWPLTPGLPRSPSPPRMPGAPSPQPRSSAPARPEVSTTPTPEILISQAEVRGLRQLIAMASRGDLALPGLLASPREPQSDSTIPVFATATPIPSDSEVDGEPSSSIQFNELLIDPVVIELLDPPPTDETH